MPRSSQAIAESRFRYYDTHRYRTDFDHEVPDIIQFVCSDKYLNRPNLYPRQGTLLKVLFLQDALFTEYDYEVIGQWEQAYLDTADEKGEGRNGIVPGVLDRIKINKAQDRKWFRETVAPIGRRGGKGHVGALAGAYVLWNYLSYADPQGHYGVDRDKRLTGIVFAGKKEQAKANQWRDLNNVILGGPIFAPHISRPQAESLTLFSNADIRRMKERRRRGIITDADQASFEIIPKESTEMAGRGPASFMQFYDEMAHVVKAVAKSEASEVYEAATPALDQFGVDAFIYLPSSPWQRIGKFYEKYLQAIEMETGDDGISRAVYPEMLMIQLTSWDIYEDWEIANQIRRSPGELPYERLGGPIQSYDHQMQQLERANPETFRVERRSWFASVLDAYLNPDRIAKMWEPWPDENRTLMMQTKGILSRTYRAHGDPSKSGAQFGFAIAHIEGPDDRGLPHVVFDVIHRWDPADFPNHEIDYDQVGSELIEFMDAFMPNALTFDQFNCLDGETLLFTEEGMQTIAEVAGEMEVGQVKDINLLVQSKDEVAAIRQVYRRGPTSVRRMRTKTGVEVVATPEHRLWVRKAKSKAWHPENEWGWLTSSEVEEGDWLCVRRDNLFSHVEVDVTDLHPEARGISRHWGVTQENGRWLSYGRCDGKMVRIGYYDTESEAAEASSLWRQENPTTRRLTRYPKTCDESLGFLLGAMVAEGKSVGGEHCSFSNSNREFMDAMAQAWSESFGGSWVPHWLPATDKWAARGVIQTSGGVAKFLYDLGCSGLSQEKRVPWVIRRSPKPVVQSFLRGLFEGDGGVTIDVNAGEWVHLTTTSADLARETQQLLLGVGVFSTLWEGWYTYQGERRRQYRVKMFGVDLIDFQREVGFVSSEKRSRLAEAVKLVEARGEKAGLRSKYQRVGDEYWVRVTSIVEEDGVECYDISVPGPESFLANGVVSHNSVSTIQRLQKHARSRQYAKQVMVSERTATHALNWKTWETFKTALGLGLVHAPWSEWANQELTFLQDLGGKVEHPTSGPVQTKDVADCFHPQTEVLTERGWMLIGEVPPGVAVATRTTDGRLEYQVPTERVERRHEGYLLEYDAHNVSFSVTPGHRMLVTTRNTDGWDWERSNFQFVRAEDLTSQRYQVPRSTLVEDRSPNTIFFDTEDTTAARRRMGRGGARHELGWTQEQDDYLRQHYATTSMVDLCAVLGKTRGAIYNRAKPQNLNLARGQIGDRIGDRPSPLPETKVEDFAGFLGIWLAEGRKVRDQAGYAIKITQTKPEGIEWIDNLFARLPWPVRRKVEKNGETAWVVKSHGLREYLRGCQGEGHELFIPDEVFTTWTHREMEFLLEGLLVGDGVWSSKDARHIAYVSTSKRLVDDVQRLLAHTGKHGRVRKIRDAGVETNFDGPYFANHDLWSVNICDLGTAGIQTKKIKRVPYDGMVYCLTVPNSTLLVRRHGVPMWSGNCLAITVYELIGDDMAALVGQSLSELDLKARPGIDPYARQREDQVHEALSAFGRGQRQGWRR